jgi:uncharacterized protein YjiS (DUF1127 family)
MSAAGYDDLDIEIIDRGDAAGTIVINGASVAARMRKTAASNTNERNPLRKGALAFSASCLGALRRSLLWFLRVLDARRDFDVLSGMSERELKDIGLTRADLGDVTALPFDASATDFLAARVEERRLATRATSSEIAHALQHEHEDLEPAPLDVTSAVGDEPASARAPGRHN